MLKSSAWFVWTVTYSFIGLSFLMLVCCSVKLPPTVTCMWSGGISGRNRVRPAGKWAKGLTYQTAKTPACHIQIVTSWLLFFVILSFNLLHIFCQSVRWGRQALLQVLVLRWLVRPANVLDYEALAK